MRASSVLVRVIRSLAAIAGLAWTASASALTNHNVNQNSVFNFPPGSYFNFDQVITVDLDPLPGSSRFFAFQFPMQGTLGYIGLQSTNPKGALFSIWDSLGCGQEGDPGSTCGTFGGEGVGYHAHIDYDWQQGHSYRLRVWQTGTDGAGNFHWGGWVMDLANRGETYLGDIVTSAAQGWLDGSKSSISFTEYFGPDFADCTPANFPESLVTWAPPTANNNDQNPGQAIASSWSANNFGGGACSAQITTTGTGPAQQKMGGCSSGGAGGSLLAALGLLVLARRRGRVAFV